jgi:hypothetical protein
MNDWVTPSLRGKKKPYIEVLTLHLTVFADGVFKELMKVK